MAVSIQRDMGMTVRESGGIPIPLGDKVIVDQLLGDKQTSGGILLPDTAREKPNAGRVVGVGPGWWDEAGVFHHITEVKIGDIVVFPNYTGVNFDHDGKTYRACSIKDLMAVLPPKTADK